MFFVLLPMYLLLLFVFICLLIPQIPWIPWISWQNCIVGSCKPSKAHDLLRQMAARALGKNYMQTQTHPQNWSQNLIENGGTEYELSLLHDVLRDLHGDPDTCSCDVEEIAIVVRWIFPTPEKLHKYLAHVRPQWRFSVGCRSHHYRVEPFLQVLFGMMSDADFQHCHIFLLTLRWCDNIRMLRSVLTRVSDDILNHSFSDQFFEGTPLMFALQNHNFIAANALLERANDDGSGLHVPDLKECRVSSEVLTKTNLKTKCEAIVRYRNLFLPTVEESLNKAVSNVKIPHVVGLIRDYSVA